LLARRHSKTLVAALIIVLRLLTRKTQTIGILLTIKSKLLIPPLKPFHPFSEKRPTLPA